MNGVSISVVQEVGSGDLERGYGFNIKTNNHKWAIVAFRTPAEAEQAAEAVRAALTNAIWSHIP